MRSCALLQPNLFCLCTPDRAQFARPAHRHGVELYRAHIVHKAFEPHTHEAFGLGAIESGVERFRYRGSEHLAPRDSLVLMNPDELHTGQAETPGGWCYRMIYLDAPVLHEISGEPDWWFPQAVAYDAVRARRVSGLLQSLWASCEHPPLQQNPLAFDSALLLLIGTLRPHARMPSAQTPSTGDDFQRVIEFMRAHLDQALRLDDLAGIAQLSPFHFLRMFKARHHTTPHQMLMALRLFAAKEQLARGEPLAQVAVAVGLTDQPHLTRCFAQRYGLTPARYQRQVRVSVQ